MPTRNRLPAFDPMLWRKRNHMGLFSNKLRHLRDIASRHDKRHNTVLTSGQRAAIRVCLRLYQPMT